MYVVLRQLCKVFECGVFKLSTMQSKHLGSHEVCVGIEIELCLLGDCTTVNSFTPNSLVCVCNIFILMNGTYKMRSGADQ